MIISPPRPASTPTPSPVGLLASALPGFREVRAPLVAGYLWLLFIWIVVDPGQPLDKHLEGTGLEPIADLASEIGPVATAAAVTAGAYLIGAVSRGTSDVLGALVRALLALTSWKLEEPTKRSRLYGRPADAIRKPWAASPIGLSAVDGAISNVEAVWDDVPEEEREKLRATAEQGAAEAARTIDAPATLLLGASASNTAGQLFGEVDRMNAEADFRLAVVPPLLALPIALAARDESLYWLLLFLAPVVLAVQAVRRHHGARRIMIQFVAYPTVMTAPAITVFGQETGDATNRAQQASRGEAELR